MIPIPLKHLLFSKNKKLSKTIKNIFGFYPENIFLYELAFQHKSIVKPNQNCIKLSNERLEYLGDAILNAIIAEFLYKKYPLRDEGFLTTLRAKIVSRNNLNHLSQKFGLSNLVKCNNDNKNETSINGNAFEAFIGAIFIDKGYKFTRKIIIQRILKYHLDIEELSNTETNYKSRLIEWAQKEKHNLEFRLVEEINNGNKKLYKIHIYLNNIYQAEGIDYSIKKAEQSAAQTYFTTIHSVSPTNKQLL